MAYQRVPKIASKSSLDRKPVVSSGLGASMAKPQWVSGDVRRQEQHQPHEARHVVQQKQGRVSTSVQFRRARGYALPRGGNVIQRTTIPIGTDSGENGTLTYIDEGPVYLDNGTKLTGMVLVLIQIPAADRGKGYGGKLMKHFVKNVVKDKPCFLDVKAVGEDGLSNDQLEAWYRKFGFETIGKSAKGPVMAINYQLSWEERGMGMDHQPSWEERGMGVDPKMKAYLGKLVQ